jgi:hypothetical protein
MFPLEDIVAAVTQAESVGRYGKVLLVLATQSSTGSEAIANQT